MTRILFRTPKAPFEVHSAATTIERNLVASNAGNLVFLDAAWKVLSAPGVEITADRLAMGPRDADRINEQFDVYVIPLANAFRKTYADALERTTQLVRRLRIPVVVLGVGAQGTVDYDFCALRPIERIVKAFMGAVLDRSPSVGARGEATLGYLEGLGFRDVDVIGCPSMFMWGDALRVERKVPALDARSRVAITISPYRRAMGPIALTALARYPHLTYVAQDLDTLSLLVDGIPLAGGTPDSPLPRHPDHPLFRERRTRFYIDPWSWFADLRHVDYVFGSRIHGAIASLVAGTPATVLAHDSRTLELARYFDLPHRLLRDVRHPLDPDDLYQEADFAALHAGHRERLTTFREFLERCRLDHVFAHDGAAAAFERQIALTPFGGAVVGRDPFGDAADMSAAARRLRSRARRLALSPGGRRVRASLRVPHR